MNYKNPWIINKFVLPQHTDHAGVMWHGTYLNWLEEARIDALSNSGMKYNNIISKGYELPVINLEITYKFPIFLGDIIRINSQFKINKGPRINIESNFIDKNNNLMTNANINLVLIKKDNFSIVKHRPDFLLQTFNNLNKGPN